MEKHFSNTYQIKHDEHWESKHSNLTLKQWRRL